MNPNLSPVVAIMHNVEARPLPIGAVGLTIIKGNHVADCIPIKEEQFWQIADMMCWKQPHKPHALQHIENIDTGMIHILRGPERTVCGVQVKRMKKGSAPTEKPSTCPKCLSIIATGRITK